MQTITSFIINPVILIGGIIPTLFYALIMPEPEHLGIFGVIIHKIKKSITMWL